MLRGGKVPVGDPHSPRTDLGVHTPPKLAVPPSVTRCSIVTGSGSRSVRLAPKRSCSVPGEVRLGEPYDEETFTRFLSLERRRSDRSGRPFFLLIVDLKERPGVSARIDETVASQLFLGLRTTLRETDFVGWYRKGCVVGAVLTESRNRPRKDVALVVRQRVAKVLGARFTSDVAERIRVGVYQHLQSERIESTDVQKLGLGRS